MMDVGSGHGLAIAGSAKDLEVAGTGSVGCHFSILSSFLTMCSFPMCHSSKSICVHILHCVCRRDMCGGHALKDMAHATYLQTLQVNVIHAFAVGNSLSTCKMASASA